MLRRELLQEMEFELGELQRLLDNVTQFKALEKGTFALKLARGAHRGHGCANSWVAGNGRCRIKYWLDRRHSRKSAGSPRRRRQAGAGPE